MIDLIQKPQTGSPWGIMVDANDPITGEVVSASVNVWNAVTDLASQSAVDTMRWYLGELSNTDISTGNYLNTLVGSHARAPQSANSGMPVLDDASIQARLAFARFAAQRRQPSSPPPAPGHGRTSGWRTGQSRPTRQKYGNNVLGSGNAGTDSRLVAARGSAVESALMTCTLRAPRWPRSEGATNRRRHGQLGLAAARQLCAVFDRFRRSSARTAWPMPAACMEEALEPNSLADWAAILNTKFPLLDEDPATLRRAGDAANIAARNEAVARLHPSPRDHGRARARARPLHGVCAINSRRRSMRSTSVLSIGNCAPRTAERPSRARRLRPTARLASGRAGTTRSPKPNAAA